jgi:3-hydroxyacyl-[acyl-carrier-protein] dehydratase
VDFLEQLPHRDPFLFVSRVVAQDTDTIVTEYDAAPEADFFRGHYPGNPLMPGVLLIECALQAGALLCAADAEEEGGVPVVTRVGEARFKRMVRPGDTLRCAAEVEERVGPARYLKAALTVDGAKALTLKYVVAMTHAPAAAGS